MEVMNEIGKLLVVGGLVLAGIGALLMLIGRLPGGMLPGDVLVQRKNFTFFFPVVTSIVVSIVLTIIVNLFFRR
jgi:hypothetical protein